MQYAQNYNDHEQFSQILSVTHFLIIMNAIGVKRNCWRILRLRISNMINRQQESTKKIENEAE
jgi:hypothetical protein